MNRRGRAPKGGRANDRRLFTPEQWRRIADSLALSPRELDIAKCVFDNMSEADMAAYLKISVHTIHTHLARLYRKLEIGGRGELIMRIFAEHLSISK